jgi:hypothetical protein
MAMEMDITKPPRNSDKSATKKPSTDRSAKLMLLKTCQLLSTRELAKEEFDAWISFMDSKSVNALRYAFEHWNENARWFPKIVDIKELCEAHDMSVKNQDMAIGCHRCDWNGFYEVSRKGVERFVAPCPCRTDPSLRERNPNYGKGYGTNDMMWLFDRMQRLLNHMDKEIADKETINTDVLLDELDAKRPDGSPMWRRQ